MENYRSTKNICPLPRCLEGLRILYNGEAELKLIIKLLHAGFSSENPSTATKLPWTFAIRSKAYPQHSHEARCREAYINTSFSSSSSFYITLLASLWP